MTEGDWDGKTTPYFDGGTSLLMPGRTCVEEAVPQLLNVEVHYGAESEIPAEIEE